MISYFYRVIFVTIILCNFKFIPWTTAKNLPIEGRQTFIDCKHQNDDKLIYNQHLQENAKLFAVQKVNILYPEKGDEREYIINCIRVYDNLALKGPHRGSTKIISGGVGHSSVIINIESARSKGYDVNIEIWGRKLDES